MSEKKTRSRRRKFLSFVFIKFPILVLIIGFIFAFALKMIERYPDPVKDGLEQYISGASKTNVSIGKMENFSFIPNVRANLFDVTFHNFQNAAEVKASVKELKFSAPFWSGLFGGGKIISLSITDLKTSVGYPLPFSIILDSLTIVDEEGPEKYGSFVRGEGKYRGLPLEFEAKLEKHEKFYKIPAFFPFSVDLGDTKVRGTIKTAYKKIDLENLIYQSGESLSSAGKYALVKGDSYITDNPLSCILTETEINICDNYLNK